MTMVREAQHRFKPHPAYKDSGVEWLGAIPAHLEVKRLSELVTPFNGYPCDSEYFLRREGIPLVRIRDLNGNETEIDYVEPIVESAWIEPGDVIIGMDGDFNVARWQGPRPLLNQRLCFLRPRNGTAIDFIAHLIPMPCKVINELTYSITVRHLSSSDVLKVCLGLPPLPEQRAIAALLDRKTAKIDVLIAMVREVIERFKEYRTAFILGGVTGETDVKKAVAA
jgi:type I restriction enzyme S subunit